MVRDIQRTIKYQSTTVFVIVKMVKIKQEIMFITQTRINIARIIHQSKVLIFREKSVFFSFQSLKPTNELNFSNFPRIPEIGRINLVPGAFLKMVPDLSLIHI